MHPTIERRRHPGAADAPGGLAERVRGRVPGLPGFALPAEEWQQIYAARRAATCVRVTELLGIAVQRAA